MAGLINYTPTTQNPQAMNAQLKPDPTPDQDQSKVNTAQDAAQATRTDSGAGRPLSQQELSAMQNTNVPPVANATAERATATGWNIDPTTQTVAGQIQGLIQRGSPLMELSKTQAEQQMAARGMQNSSLGITAGQNAVYQSALPIASQDASQYGKAAEFTAGSQNAASNLNAQLGTNVNLANAGASNTAANLGAQLTSAQKIQQMQNDTTLSVTDKQIAATKILEDARIKSALDLQNIQSNTSLTVADKQAATQKYVSDQNTETQKYLQGEEALLKTALQDKDAATRTAIQTSANNSAKDIANIQADYQTLIRSDASASQALSDATRARQEVIMNPTMSVEGREAAFNIINNQLKAALNLHGSINGVDLTPLLNSFGGDQAVATTPTAAPTAQAAVAPTATPITTKSGVSFSSDDVKGYMAQNKFDDSNAKGYMDAVQKWNTDNPTKQISLDDLGAAHGMNPAQTAAWMKANPGK